MIRRTEGIEELRLSELAEILAAGYERLLAQSRPDAKNDDDVPELPAPTSLYPLDTSRDQSDESCSRNIQSVN